MYPKKMMDIAALAKSVKQRMPKADSGFSQLKSAPAWLSPGQAGEKVICFN